MNALRTENEANYLLLPENSCWQMDPFSFYAYWKYSAVIVIFDTHVTKMDQRAARDGLEVFTRYTIPNPMYCLHSKLHGYYFGFTRTHVQKFQIKNENYDNVAGYVIKIFFRIEELQNRDNYIRNFVLLAVVIGEMANA